MSRNPNPSIVDPTTKRVRLARLRRLLQDRSIPGIAIEIVHEGGKEVVHSVMRDCACEGCNGLIMAMLEAADAYMEETPTLSLELLDEVVS